MTVSRYLNSLEKCQADPNNGETGIYQIHASGLDGSTSSTSIEIHNTSADNNGVNGISKIFAYSQVGPSSILLDNVSATENSLTGINEITAIANEREAFIRLDNISAQSNDSFGLGLVVSVGSYASIDLLNSDLTGNAVGGYLSLSANTPHGSGDVTVINVVE